MKSRIIIIRDVPEHIPKISTSETRNNPNIDYDKVIVLEMARNLLVNRGLTIEQVISIIIQENAIIGVGLISLGDHLREYCYKHQGYIKNDKLQK